MFSYTQLIVAAARIAVRHKYLWFFGLFATLLANSGILQRVYTNDIGGILNDWQRLKSTGIFDSANVGALLVLAGEQPAWFALRVFVLLVVAALGAFIFWLSVISQGALVYSVGVLSSQKKMTFRVALQSGLRSFWSVLWLRVVLEKGLIVVLLFGAGLLGGYAFLPAAPPLARAGAGVALVVVLAVLLAVILITRYAMSYAILERARLVEALGKAFVLLRRSSLVSIEAVAVIFIVNILLGFAALMLIAALAIPGLLVLFLFYQWQFVAGFSVVLVVGIALLVAVVIVVSAAVTTFSEALWTLFFMRVSREALPHHISNLLRLWRKA